MDHLKVPKENASQDGSGNSSAGGSSSDTETIGSSEGRKRFSVGPLDIRKHRAPGEVPLEDIDKQSMTIDKSKDNPAKDETKELHETPRTSTVSDNKPGRRTLEVLDGSNILDYEVDSFIDPMKHYEAAHIILMSQKGKHNAWEDEENPTPEYLKKKERQRLEKLKRDRGRCISYTFTIVYHAMVVICFVYSWTDAFKLIIQEAKLQTYHLQGVYNCMEVIQKANEGQFLIEIIHAMMSACVLFAETSANACLCMGFIFVQAVHTVYKAFQVFMQFRYINGSEQVKMVANFLLILICNVFASILVIQRYYDLTDGVRTRAKILATNTDEGGSMNDEIIYQNQSSFVRRKYILRQAVALQVYRIVQKIDGCNQKGLPVDKVELYKEIKAATLALKDVDGVENRRMMKELKRANAKRLKEMENDPVIKNLDASKTKTFSELFLVKFSDDDIADRKQTLLRDKAVIDEYNKK